MNPNLWKHRRINYTALLIKKKKITLMWPWSCCYCFNHSHLWHVLTGWKTSLIWQPWPCFEKETLRRIFASFVSGRLCWYTITHTDWVINKSLLFVLHIFLSCRLIPREKMEGSSELAQLSVKAFYLNERKSNWQRWMRCIVSILGRI